VTWGCKYKVALREQKTARKKEEIIQAAVSVFMDKGYTGTTMEDVAANLLMTKGSVYYYFKDKQELLYQSQKMLLEKSIENIEVIKQAQDLPVIERLRKSMIVHIKYLISERSGFETMVDPERYFTETQVEKIIKLRNNYEKNFDQLITEGIERNIFASLDIKIVRNIILGAMNWVIQWYSPKGEKDAMEVAELITDYLLRILIKDTNMDKEELHCK